MAISVDPKNSLFSRHQLQMVKKHMQRRSTHLGLNKMQAGTMLKVHLTHQNVYHQESKCWQGCGNKGTYIHSWCEGKLVCLLSSEIYKSP